MRLSFTFSLIGHNYHLESSRCFYFSLVVMYLRISVQKIVAADGDTPTLNDKAENLSDVAKYLWLIPY